jgi:tellurite resistance protein TehA-like permease
MASLSVYKNKIQTLSPSYFALVMATGIVSKAAYLQEQSGISTVLFWTANICFLVLLVLFLWRLFSFFPNVADDLSSHEKGAGFLTLTAGACILGTSYAQVHGAFDVATLFWYFGMLTWAFLVFAFLSNVILSLVKPSPEKGLNGSWFLLVVSTQALSILVGTLSPQLVLPPNITIFFSLFDFLLGAMLYLLLVPVVTYRLLFFPMKPEEVSPSYWINMGAAAITTLAGVSLLPTIRSNPQFADLYPFVYGASLLFWCIASFWIPLVFIMELWRYIGKRSPLEYKAAFWSMVFPLGMYSVATWKLADVVQLSFLKMLSTMFLYIALIAWLVTFVGMVVHIFKTTTRAEQKPSEPSYITSNL